MPRISPRSFVASRPTKKPGRVGRASSFQASSVRAVSSALIALLLVGTRVGAGLACGRLAHGGDLNHQTGGKRQRQRQGEFADHCQPLLVVLRIEAAEYSVAPHELKINVREGAGEPAAACDRPISEHPNLVTAEGLAQINEALARLHEVHACARTAADRAVIAGLGRDLRYWTARRSFAQLISAPEDNDEVQFGSTVTILRDGGRRQTWRIVEIA